MTLKSNTRRASKSSIPKGKGVLGGAIRFRLLGWERRLAPFFFFHFYLPQPGNPLLPYHSRVTRTEPTDRMKNNPGTFAHDISSERVGAGI